MELALNNMKASIADALDKSNIKYDLNDLEAVKISKTGEYDISGILKKCNIDQEKMKEISKYLPTSFQNAHSNICTTEMATSGNLMTTIGRHLPNISSAIDNITTGPDATHKAKADIIKSEANMKFMDTIGYNPSEAISMMELVDNDSAVVAMKRKDDMAQSGLVAEPVESENISQDDNVAIFSYMADKSHITTMTMATIQALSAECFEDVLSGAMTSQQHNNLINYIIRKLGFDIKIPESKAERKMAEHLKESHIYTPLRKLEPEAITLTNGKKAQTKSTHKDTEITLVPVHSRTIEHIKRIFDESGQDILRNNKMTNTGQLKIHAVKKGKGQTIATVNKLRRDGHDVHICKVGDAVTLIPSMDLVLPRRNYISARSAVLENALLKELNSIYELFNAIISRCGESKTSMKSVPQMLFYSLIDKSKAITTILEIDPKYNDFEILCQRLGEEKVSFIKTYLSMAISTMAEGTGYSKMIRNMIRVVCAEEKDFKWLPPHTGNYVPTANHLVDGMFKISKFIVNSSICNVSIFNGISVYPRTCQMYKLLMHQAKSYMYRASLMYSTKDDIMAIAATHLNDEQSYKLGDLLNELQLSIMAKDKVYIDSLQIGLPHNKRKVVVDDLPFFDFIGNTLASVYFASPLNHTNDLGEMVNRMIRLHNQPTNAIMRLLDPNVNIADKSMMLGPVFKIWKILNDISKSEDTMGSTLNRIDMSLMQLPLDWFMSMFDDSSSDESIGQILICLSMLKSVMSAKEYESVYIGLFRSLCKILDNIGMRPLISFLNEYSPEDGEEHDDIEIAPEEIVDAISKSNLNHVLVHIKKVHDSAKKSQ